MPSNIKQPQTIDHWIGKYVQRLKSRGHSSIKIGTAKDQVQKIGKFRELADTSKHVTTITDETLDKYAQDLDEQDLEKASKQSYFNSFRMFLREYADSRTVTSSKKSLEISTARSPDFGSAMEPAANGSRKRGSCGHRTNSRLVLTKVPQPYRAYLVTMLNCGFRSTDLNALRKEDVHLKIGRIIIQREKMNQNDTSPVVNYPLWPITVQLIQRSDVGRSGLCVRWPQWQSAHCGEVHRRRTTNP